MSESPAPSSDAPAGDEVVARASHEGIAVRKVATMHGESAVAVYFTIRSIREDRCTVRIADALAEPLRDNEVEFHPKYDPVNWTRVDGTVVYSSSVPPDANRTTVYGVVVDDPSQLEHFSAEPAVEVTDSQPAGSGDGTDTGFSFKPSQDVASGESSADDADSGRSGNGSVVEDPGTDPSDGTKAVGDATLESTDIDVESTDPHSDGPGIGLDGTEDSGPGGRRPREEGRDSVLEALVSEVRRRDLTRAERRSLRKALGLEGADALGTQLDSLREQVEALRDEVAAADRQAADVDRLESQIDALADALDDRYASLSADIEALQEDLSREVRWRDRLSESLTRESGAE